MIPAEQRILEMVSERAELSTLAHDNLTAYYYGDGLEGARLKRNFKLFYWFFRDVEDEFGVIFPLGVWDRGWKISQFSAYVEKLSSEPHRSIVNGRKALDDELNWVDFAFYFVAAIIAVVIGIFEPPMFIFGCGGIAVLLVKKVRRVNRLRSRLRQNEVKLTELKRNKQREAPTILT